MDGKLAGKTGPRVWWEAARPRTLGASVIPVLVGTAYASRSNEIDGGILGMTVVAALALQIATNLANDYYDFRHGIDTGERLGPVRASASGRLSPTKVKRAAYVSLGLGVLVGACLVWRGGWPILGIGMAAAVCAIAYSAGPTPLASLGVGELLAFVFFGVLAVTGSAHLQGCALRGEGFLVSLPIAALVTAIMVVNNLRDIPTDRATGKRTLAVRLGEEKTRNAYVLLVGGAFVSALFVAYRVTPGALLPIVLGPLSVAEMRALCLRGGRELNLSLAGTARLHGLFGLLYAIGLAL